MQTARVSSIQALREFKAALQQYVLDVQKALCEADLEYDRVRDWVMHDQPAHWSMELKKRHDEVLRAKDELRRVQLSIAQNPPSAAEQKKALKVAHAREQEAMNKQKVCKRWQRQIDQAGNEYRGQVQHISSALDSDFPRALAQLERAVAALESYVSTAAPRAEEDEFAADHPVASSATGAAAAPADDFPIEACRALRRITASVAHLPSIPSEEIPGTEPDEESPPQNTILFRDRLAVPRIKPQRDDRVILDKAAFDQDAIYLERIHPDDQDDQRSDCDSGWFIGRAARQQIGEVDPVAMTVAEVLERWPQWREILSLPHGHLVVISEGQIRRLLDPHDVDLWAKEFSEDREGEDGSATLEASNTAEQGSSS